MQKTIGIMGNPFRLPYKSKTNTGNIVHANAALSLFSAAAELRRDTSDEYIEQTRSQCSHLGFAAATMLQVNSTARWIDAAASIAEFVKKLDLPVVAFGIGTSSAKVGTSLRDANIDPRSVHLLRTLADHAETIAVRGEFTADLCRKVGVTNVDIVGCQSLYYSASLNDPSAWNHREKTGRSVSSITGTMDLTQIVDFCIRHDVDLIGQNETVEQDIALGEITVEAFTNKKGGFRLPKSISDTLNTDIVSLERYHNYVFSHFYKFYDMDSWVSHVAKHYDFAFGTRFHGNVAALQSGVPALWLTHDIRTVELCQHFGLPNIPAKDFGNYSSLQELKDITDFSLFRAKFPERSGEFLRYLERNGVREYLSDNFITGLKPWQYPT